MAGVTPAIRRAPQPARAYRAGRSITLQLVRPVIRQSCILLAAVNSWASHNPATSKTPAIAKPASARRRLPSCSGSGSFILRLVWRAATERKLTDRAFDVEFDSSHLGE